MKNLPGTLPQITFYPSFGFNARNPQRLAKFLFAENGLRLPPNLPNSQNIFVAL